MEYRCRLGTAGGQLIDGVYVAENEAQLRRELEEKGMLVLSVRPTRATGRAGAGLRSPETHPLPRFPRVQPGAGHAAESGHAARAVAGPAAPGPHRSGVQAGPRRGVRAREGRRAAVGCLRRAGRPRAARLHGVAARRRAQRQPGDRAAALRRLRQADRRRPPQDDQRADVSGRPARARRRRCRHHRPQARAGVLAVLFQLRGRTAGEHAIHHARLGVHPRVRAVPGRRRSSGASPSR